MADDIYSPFWVMQYTDSTGQKFVKADYSGEEILKAALDAIEEANGSRRNIYIGYFGLGGKPVDMAAEFSSEVQVRETMHNLQSKVVELSKDHIL